MTARPSRRAPPVVDGAVDADLAGVVLHAGDRHWHIKGRDAAGRHLAAVCDVNGRDLRPVRLETVDPSIPAYARLLAARVSR